ncbi:MAG: primosomal protein N' [Bacteroidales bacterium]|jgi:primosomal protein N' (replication factor Y)|nr:primosomal protein N' [Bacteroidales bacterium]
MMNNHFADIILPLAYKGILTYSIPVEMDGSVQPGSRVLVQLGNRKLYSGIVSRIHNIPPDAKNLRPVMRVLDAEPVVNEIQLKLWNWISEYYMCSAGEVMKAALPSDLCLEGVTEIPMTEKYRPKEESFVRLASAFTEDRLNAFLDSLSRAPVQLRLLTVYLDLSGYVPEALVQPVRKSLLLKEAGSAPGSIDGLLKKGILEIIEMETGRLADYKSPAEPLKQLTGEQETALKELKKIFSDRETVLLHGVTSSGKTEIYIHLIEEQLKMGKQVLYLLPEIALTTQIIQRLQKHFGPVTGIYHSRFSNAERVEIWNRVGRQDRAKEYNLIIGARSALFLPFRNLGLIIVDEEHDGSYKQHDPAPRYNARDSAIVLAGFHRAKTVLGSASPSVETYNNAITGKYGLVELRERFGSVKLPGIVLADTREAYRKKLMVSHFTPQLIEAIDGALANNEQVVLFQNRRGFSPYLECPECGWIPKCVQCAVSLTYHKGITRMVCHYCGYSSPIPSQCGNCGSPGLQTRGFGTEKIEDEIKIVFPSARVARMDQDTTRGKNSFERIIRAMEDGQTDILIGTQMISKGLDIENLTVVGILNADNLLNYPDFRAHERSFQLMEQVSGRAGRRTKTGKVVIQTSDPGNKMIRLVLNHDYRNMFRIQMDERKAFNYPPFCRMIRISVKHRDRSLLNSYSDILARDLKSEFGKRILGPEFAPVSQVQLWYIKNILVKLEREKPAAKAKMYISGAIERLLREKGASSLRIAVDVDPY